MDRPRVFIGSSAEGLRIAESLFACLKHSTEPTLWTHDLFRPGRYPLEELERQLKLHPFAVLVASPDDEVFKRGETSAAMRDNLLVEFGLFAGAVGHRCVFFVCPSEPQVALPSDLAGIVHAKYEADRVAKSPSDRAAAVQVPCQQIRDVIEEEWRRIKEEANKARARLRASQKGQALERLHGVAVQLRDALMTVQHDAFAALSDEVAFEEVKIAAADRVEEIAASFEEDAEMVDVEKELQALTEATTNALKDLPFPRELGLGREAARQKVIDLGAGALSEFLGGGDPLQHLSNVTSSEAGARIESLKERYAVWWDKHSDPLQAATKDIQDALFHAAMDLVSSGEHIEEID